MIKSTSLLIGCLMTALVLMAGCDRFTSVESRLARASANLDAGEYQAALIDVRKALNRQPDNVDAQLLYIDVLVASGDMDTARFELDKMIAAGAQPAAAERRQLRLLIAIRDADAVEKALAASTTLSAAERAAFGGRLLMMRGQYSEAEAAFQKALALAPDLLEANLGRVEAIAAQGRSEDALRELEVLLAREPGSGSAWLLKGSLEARSGNPDLALDAFERALTEGRGLSRADVLRAHAARTSILLMAGRLADARQSLAALEEIGENTALLSLIRARVALASGDVSTAVNELRQYTRIVPADLTGRMLLSAALLQQGSTEQAYAEAVRTVADFPGQDEPRLALAEVQLQLGHVAEAEEALTALAAQSPPNPLALAILGQIRFRGGESLAGVEFLERSLEVDPENPQLKLRLAAGYVAAGQASRAMTMLDGMSDADRGASGDRLRVIASAAQEGPAAAARQLQEAITKHPEDVSLLELAASYYAGVGELDRARGYLEQAISIRPDDARLALGLARLELLDRKQEKAEALARAVLDRSPESVEAMVLLAGISSQRGMQEEADAWLERARAVSPESVEVSLALARRALSRGSIDRARQILEELERATPGNVAALVALGELDASIGRFPEALAKLQQAAQRNPKSPQILLSIARVHLAAQEPELARQALRRALELAPTWLPAASVLAALEVRDGKLAEALEIARTLRQADPQETSSYVLEGDVYMAATRPADAAKAYMSGYRITPSAALATRSVRAKVMAKLPRPEAELVDWLEHNADDAIARRDLAGYRIGAGQRDAAIRDLEIVLESRPNDVIALNNLAWLYQEVGDKRALVTAERVYKAAPNVPSVADTYGWILVQGGDATGGLEILRQAAESQPKNGEFKYHLAYALDKAGQRDQAIAALRGLLDSGVPFASRAEAESLLASLED